MSENTAGFVTPPAHINFLAKKLFAECGNVIDGAIAYLAPGGGGPTTAHTHSHAHLFIVVSGKAKIVAGDEAFVIGPNEAKIITGSIPHSVWNAAETTTVMIGISLAGEKAERISPANGGEG